MRHWTTLCTAAALLGACGGRGAEGGPARESLVTDTAVTKPPPATPGAVPPAVGEPGPREAAPTSGAVPRDTTVLGVVAVAGAAPLPQIVLRSAGAASVALIGPLRGELSALAGAEVRARGHVVTNPLGLPPRAVEATSYEVVSVGGRTPRVGILRAGAGGLELGGTPLIDPPQELLDAVGSKVWIVGTEQGGALRIEVYGFIRRPS